jgi:hypothetical protein
MKNTLKRRKDQERDKLGFQEQINSLDLEIKGAQEELLRKKEISKSSDFGPFKSKLGKKEDPLKSLDLDKEQLDVKISVLDIKKKPTGFFRKKRPLQQPTPSIEQSTIRDEEEERDVV